MGVKPLGEYIDHSLERSLNFCTAVHLDEMQERSDVLYIYEKMGLIFFYVKIFAPTHVTNNSIYSQNCLNGHLFQPITCPYSQLSVTPLRFHYLFDNCITIPSQCSHGQPFCTPKWPLMAKAMITDGQVNHLQKRLRSLFIAFSLYGLRIYLQTMELTDDPICLVLSTQIRFVASHMA